ncbi:hypothetical protein OP10G_3476 [Fimbriimonas ginsengisoli Gsoil 348]|uniref:Uncharacterized protein n=1 Tax=Fimbriimonas ginsengisoli Gsoil 348 TaxID=661478 RepID=A0A068NYC3_FIMGI|nr:hypothetical protein OP10G_3476 [Fimbriimonas ginsengisoli Gsoil 348]
MEYRTEFQSIASELPPQWFAVAIGELGDSPQTCESSEEERPVELPLGFV